MTFIIIGQIAISSVDLFVSKWYVLTYVEIPPNETELHLNYFLSSQGELGNGSRQFECIFEWKRNSQ